MNPIDQPSRARRFILPLIVAIVAVGMIIWSRQQAAKRDREVVEFIENVCADVAAGRDVRGRINPDDPFVEERTIEQLRTICSDPATASRLEVQIVEPKLARGVAIGGKSHAAMLRLDGVDRLGLVLRHEGDPAAIGITGYWHPGAAVNTP